MIVTPFWIHAGLAVAAALLILWNVPRNLLASAVLVVSLATGVWAFENAWELASGGVESAFIVGFTVALFLSAFLLLSATLASAAALARRKPLWRPASAVATTAIGFALAAAWWLLVYGVMIIFFLGE